ncbi:MAG: phosphate acyltransferase PlsX [Spirochaetota bacterium]|nr:phosphate acyltransferase PlsX [Spirochaetota bacterium]
MKIAVDVMSGENEPEVLIKGALQAVDESDVEIILVGDEGRIYSELKKHKDKGNQVSVVHSSEVILMNETPAKACRKKPDASVMVASQLVAKKKADGFFSPGNTGATITASLLNIKRVQGVSRPAIAIMVPTAKGHTLLLDAGANVDSTPKNIVQFAIMGDVFMKHIVGVNEPKVALLNIGEEDKKGNELSLKAYELLKTVDFNFVGNIEGHDVYEGNVDVIVCDGFIGNIVLKLSEGLGDVMMRLIKNEIIRNFSSRFGAFMARGAFRNVKNRLSAETYGGAPLLGINGCAIVGHGNTGAIATKNGIHTAVKMVKANINQLIKENTKRFMEDAE